MLKDFIFFKEKGEEGISLTSTSANHIANLAKEYIQTIESDLNNIRFLRTTVSLIGNGEESLIEEGYNEEMITTVSSRLQDIASAKSLIAWLREAIKAKENILKELDDLSVNKWAEDQGIEYPTVPNMFFYHTLTEDEYISSLSIKERNMYYQLETEAAVLGKYIHPNGPLAIARKGLKEKLQHPHKVDGKGRDALIYTFTPTIPTDTVETLFFELQKKHRETQAQLNSIKNRCELAICESKQKANAEYNNDLAKYTAELTKLNGAFKEWKDNKAKELRELKIRIPNSLLDIYIAVNSLGK